VLKTLVLGRTSDSEEAGQTRLSRDGWREERDRWRIGSDPETIGNGVDTSVEERSKVARLKDGKIVGRRLSKERELLEKFMATSSLKKQKREKKNIYDVAPA